jgi:amidophosphoribosyltransferase
MCGIYARLSYYRSRCTLEKILQQLDKLQHRGSDGIGVALSGKYGFVSIKLMSGQEAQFSGSGDMGIGHVRYKTKGKVGCDSCQPFYHNDNIALVHNGHIDNVDYEPDTLLLMEYFKQYPKKNIFTIVQEIMRAVPDGSYSCIVMIYDVGLVAFRDPRGIRPLVYHQNEDRVLIASESCVLSENVSDVEPGECIVFDKHGSIDRRICTPTVNYTPCIFEYIYFAHKNSIINGIHVYKARQVLGDLLAKKISEKERKEYDMIVPVPKTSCVSALEMSRTLNIPYREILTVSKGRSFILPRQTIRESLIQEKFQLDTEKCIGKHVLLVDDSIVRGSTMRSLIKRFREAGVSKITIASCAPPVRSINVYGIDISSKDELVINQSPNQSEEMVAEKLGADRVIYQDLTLMLEKIRDLNPNLAGFEHSMFL